MKKYSIINPHELRITNEFGSFGEMKEYLERHGFPGVHRISKTNGCVGGQMLVNRNSKSFRYACVRESNPPIELLRVDPGIMSWSIRTVGYTNGLYDAWITMREDNVVKGKYIPKIRVFRNPDAITRFGGNDDVMLVNQSRSVFYDNIKDADVRFSRLENIAIRFLRIYTI